jgi:hypothetical protein
MWWRTVKSERCPKVSLDPPVDRQVVYSFRLMATSATLIRKRGSSTTKKSYFIVEKISS